jgi:hypothetical protein
MPPVPGPKTRYPAGEVGNPHHLRVDEGISEHTNYYNTHGGVQRDEGAVPHPIATQAAQPGLGIWNTHASGMPHAQAPMPAPAPIAYPGAVMMLMQMMRGGGGGPGSPGFIAPP